MLRRNCQEKSTRVKDEHKGTSRRPARISSSHMASPSATSPMLVDTALVAKLEVDAGILMVLADSRKLIVGSLDFNGKLAERADDCMNRSLSFRSLK